MKILSISPGNGWLSRWQSKDRSNPRFLELEVFVFAVIEGEKGHSRISSFSGPTGDDSFIEGIPDDMKQDAYEDSLVFDEWPWHFQQWVKVRDPNASQVAFDRTYSE